MNVQKFADVDHEDYKANLTDRISDSYGFYDVTYWDAKNTEDFKELSRKEWIYMYEHGSVTRSDVRIPGYINLYAAFALNNVVYGFLLYQKVVRHASQYSIFQLTWFLVTLGQIFIWSPIYIIWPLLYSKNATYAGWFVSACQFTKMATGKKISAAEAVILLGVTFGLKDDQYDDSDGLNKIFVIATHVAGLIVNFYFQKIFFKLLKAWYWLHYKRPRLPSFGDREKREGCGLFGCKDDDQDIEGEKSEGCGLFGCKDDD